MSRTLKHAGHVHAFKGSECVGSIVAGFPVSTDAFMFADWAARAIMIRNTTTSAITVIEPGYAAVSSTHVSGTAVAFVAQKYSDSGSFENNLIIVCDTTASSYDVALPSQCADAIGIRVFGGSFYVMSGNDGTVCSLPLSQAASGGTWNVVFTPSFTHVPVWPDEGSIAFLSFDMSSANCAYMLYNIGPVVHTTVAHVCNGSVSVDYFPDGILVDNAWTSNGVIHGGGDIVVAHGQAHVFLGEGRWGSTSDEIQNPTNALSKHMRLNVGTTGHVVCGSGFRHAWTASFDTVGDAFYVGDVGLSSYEEVTRIPYSEACLAGGKENFYGWPKFEGFARGQLEARQSPGSILRPPMFVMQHVCVPSNNFNALIGGEVGGIAVVWLVAFMIVYFKNGFKVRDMIRRTRKVRAEHIGRVCAFALSCIAFAFCATLLIVPWTRTEHDGYTTWMSLFVSGFGASPAGKGRVQYGTQLMWENKNTSAYAVPICVGVSIMASLLAMGFFTLNAVAAAADAILLIIVCTRVNMYDGYENGPYFIGFTCVALVLHLAAFSIYNLVGKPRIAYMRV
jgi:hypothetical protein